MKKILLALLLIPTLAGAAQQEITVVPDNPVIPSIGSLKDAINLRLADIDDNFDEIYPILSAGPVYVNTTAPASTKVVWIDTDQDNAIKVRIGEVWTVVGTAGEGSYTLPTASADTLGGVKVGDRLSITDGVLSADVQTTDISGKQDVLVSGTNIKTINSTSLLGSGNITISGSATYPSAAGVANWNGSAWGTSYTVGTTANNLVQLNASAQLPAVSGALLTNIPMPSWLPSAAPTSDNMIIQATGGCSNIAYTNQSTCEGNSGTWTPPVGAWTGVIDGLINDAGTGTDDLLSASEIDSRISSAGAFYQEADGDLDTAAGASAAGASKLFGTNASGVVGWYDIPVDTDTDDQTASEVGFTPNGSIAATTVQAAVQEVRDEVESKSPTTLSLTADTTIATQQIADNKYLSNYGSSAEVDIVLPAISYNQTRTILIEAAQVLEISPPPGEVLELSGTDLTADYCVNSGSIVGNKATATRLRTGASTWKWSIDVVRGAWESCGGTSD